MFVAYIFAFLKNVIYGLSVFFTGSLSESVDVLDILALRFLLSFGVMWLFKMAKIIKVDIGFSDFLCHKKDRRNLKLLLLTALFEPVLYMLFETLGISMTTGVTAGVILSLMPIASCISETVILKEKTTSDQTKPNTTNKIYNLRSKNKSSVYFIKLYSNTSIINTTCG